MRLETTDRMLLALEEEMKLTGEVDQSASMGLSRDSLSAMIYKSLRSNLMTGAYEPGERLNIRRLASSFDTSPTPVREAVMQLVREGGLELRPGHELRVPILSVDRYVKIRQVRAPLERLATELTAELIGEATLRDLTEINQLFLDAENGGRWKDALSLNAKFHFTIYANCGNELLVNAIENLWLLSGPFLINQFPSAIHPHDDQHPHLRLIDALRRHAASEAGEIVIRGLEKGSALIIEKLKQDPH